MSTPYTWGRADGGVSRTSSVSSRTDFSMFVHVRCKQTSKPSAMTLLASSKLACWVLPPAPHVTESHDGARDDMRSRRSSRLVKPILVLGGKTCQTDCQRVSTQRTQQQR